MNSYVSTLLKAGPSRSDTQLPKKNHKGGSDTQGTKHVVSQQFKGPEKSQYNDLR